jgi:hypothetical protein
MIRIMATILFSISEKQTIDLPTLYTNGIRGVKTIWEKTSFKVSDKKKSVHFISRMLSHTQKGWLQFPVFSSASKPHTDYYIFSKFVRTKIVRKKFVNCNWNSHGCKVNKTTKWSRVSIMLSSDYLTCS